MRDCVAGRPRWFVVALVLVVGLVVSLGPVHAQDSGTVEELSGRIEPGVGVFCVIPGLERGETVYVYASGRRLRSEDYETTELWPNGPPLVAQQSDHCIKINRPDPTTDANRKVVDGAGW